MAIALSGSTQATAGTMAGTSSQAASSSSVATSLLDQDKKGTSGEMLAGCSVCLDDEGTEENPLVYCDGCEVAVHRACYGIVSVPPGNWYCRKCEFSDGRTKIKCELCPFLEGALKKTETGQWAHVVCALYIPEVRFSNNNTMEPIEIKHIQADRYNKNCYLCEESGDSTKASYGAVMDCHKIACKQSFHVTCAQSAGLLCEEAGEEQDNIIYCGYCKHHFRKLKAGNRKHNNSLLHTTSSYADPASDSSQDNDLRCNTTTENDKNSSSSSSSSSYRTNKLSNMPNNLPAKETLAINSHNLSTTMRPNVTTDNNNKSMSSSAPISLSIPLMNTSSNPNKVPTTQASTPQKKKRPPKNVQSDTNPNLAVTNNTASTLLTTAGSMTNTLGLPIGPLSNINDKTDASQDVYNWSNMDKEQYGSTQINNNNISTANNNKVSKKKATPSTQSSTSKPSGTSSTPSLTTPSSSQPKQAASPNFSLSSSPSLASSSNSTKSNSNSSSSSSSISTTSATSSTCSTSSNSPSPALLSPNASNRGSTAKLESPLASNSKPSSTHNRLSSDAVQSNSASHVVQSNSHMRINLDSLKNDLKKNITTNSPSLLSTTIPLDSTTTPVSAPSLTKMTGGNGATLLEKSNADAGFSRSSGSAAENSDIAKFGTTTDTQPMVPPLIIPVPQTSTSISTTTTKPTAKAKAAPKRKKPATESTESTKPESKPKASRSKKVPIVKDGAADVPTTVPKPEPKRRKSKTASKQEESAAIPTLDNATPVKAVTSTPSKRKSRSASGESTSAAAATTTATAAADVVVAAPSPAKRVRKKKEPATTKPISQLTVGTGATLSTSSATTHLPPATSSLSVGAGSSMINPHVMNNRLIPSGMDHDVGNRYFSPMISPYANFDHLSTPSLSRSSLSRLFTSSSADNNNSAGLSDDPAKAFEELRENTWNTLSRCVLDQAQQFDIPSLIGTLYTLRAENEKLVNKVRDLTMRRDQLVAMNARLDLPGPLLTQHLNNTSPNFSSVVSGLTNSPKSLPTPSPGSAINKQPLVTVGSYNHVPPGPPIGPPGYLDRSSPLVGQSHSGLSNIKASTISTPSPPIGALMAHSTSNRAGLITVNTPYMPNAFPNMNTLGSLGSNLPGSSYYPRQ